MKKLKKFGQHFLSDQSIATDTIDRFLASISCKNVLEIGPGEGFLTAHLLDRPDIHLKVVELDERLISFLEKKYPNIQGKLIHADFLQLDLKQLFQGEPFAVIGNFPYNISSQIIFKILDDIELVPQLVGMFQKEFADRVISMPGKKDYGIPSLLTQVYYNCEKWLDLAPELFDPPPKVWSSIISLKRKEVIEKDFDHRIFKLLIKQSFQNRRKMLRNTISEFFPNGEIPQLPSFSRETATLRPEQLHYQDFIYLSKLAKI